MINILNPEFKTKWLEALRSGEYRQGGFMLMRGGDTNTYCFLGVACRVSGQIDEEIRGQGLPNRKLIPEWFEDINNKFINYDEASDYFRLMIPYEEEVFKEYGIDYTSESLSYVSLSALNDCGVSFKVIADLIEKYL